MSAVPCSESSAWTSCLTASIDFRSTSVPVKKLGAVDQRPGDVDPSRCASWHRRRLHVLRHGLHFLGASAGARESSGKAPPTISSGLRPESKIAFSLGPRSSFVWMWLELSMCSHWAGTGLLLRSFSMPVARAERPNSARKGLVMLPSASAIAGMVSRNVGERLRDRAGVQIRRAGDLVDGVDQHLGLQAAQRIAGKIGLGFGLVEPAAWRKTDRCSRSGSAGRGASDRSRWRSVPSPDRPAARDCSAGCRSRISSGSWMMPRPSSHAQTRLTMLRVNQGFSGVISQSAKTSRGSRSGGNSILVPSGKTAVGRLVLVGGSARRFVPRPHRRLAGAC